MKLNLGIVAGILLLVPLSAGVAGQAPRPNSGGSELEGIRGQDWKAGADKRAGARLEGGGKPRPYGFSPFRSGSPELGRGTSSSPPPSVTLSFEDSFDMPGYALRSLMTALTTYPNARTFRVSWSILVFNNQIQTTILYDRRAHSLLFYSIGDGDVLGTQHDHFRFTRVPESVFGKIAWAHRNDTSEDGWAWLGDLPKYGCRKVVLESSRKGPV